MRHGTRQLSGKRARHGAGHRRVAGFYSAAWPDIAPPLTDDAFYVLGSAREGGMGAPEAVPFGTESAAQAFAIQEGGAVMRLAQIPDKLVLAPAETGTSGNADDADFEDRLRALSHPEDKP